MPAPFGPAITMQRGDSIRVKISAIPVSQPQFFEPVLHFLEMEVERAEFFEFAGLEMFRHGRVSFQDLDKIGVVAAGVLHLPGLHRRVLDELVGGFARQAFSDERQQHGLRIPHAEAQAEILLHVLRINVESVHQARQQAEHVVEQRAGVGKDDALDAAVADVALVPEGDVFQRGEGVAAKHAGEAGEAFPGDGVALVRHGAAAFLALGKRFLGLQHLGALQVAELNRPTFDARADEGQRGLKFGMDVALDDLGGNRRGSQAELLAHGGLDFRRQVGAGADGAGELADGGDFARAFEAFERAAKFVVHERELEAEGGRFAMDAVAAADAGHELGFPRPPRDDFAQRLYVGDENVGALNHLHGAGGVTHVAAGQAEMEPAAGRAVDFLGDGGGEGDDVVIEDFLQFLLAGDQAGQVGKPFIGAGLDFGEVGCGHDALLDERLAGEEFDLEPDAELVFVRPDGPHFRA